MQIGGSQLLPRLHNRLALVNRVVAHRDHQGNYGPLNFYKSTSNRAAYEASWRTKKSAISTGAVLG